MEPSVTSLKKLPLSERACAVHDKHSAVASAFYLQSRGLVWFKIALSLNQAAAFCFFSLYLRHKDTQKEEHTRTGTDDKLFVFQSCNNQQKMEPHVCLFFMHLGLFK